MNQIQQELDANPLSVDIQILGINERGHEIGNEGMTDGRDLPWLQDVDADDNGISDVWYDSWDITYRDVMILDTDNTHVATFNLTQHDLSEQENFDNLKALLISTAEAAATTTTTWHNAAEPLDVDGDSFIVPLDVLHIFNELNSVGPYELPTSGVTVEYFYDTNDDGFISPLDALLVLNYLNAQAAGQANEANAAAARAALDVATVEQSDATAPLDVEAVDNLMADEGPGHAIELDLSPLPSQDQLQFNSNLNDDTGPFELLELELL